MTDDRAVAGEDPQALAQRVADGMYARDQASQALGMRITDVAPGRARMTMTVRADMLNGHAICHGGFIFTLADSTFAFACNSYNLATVASACAIDFLAPAREGDLLTAAAVERSAAGRTGVYDIEVTNQRGEKIALFRGKSYRINGRVVDDKAQAGDAKARAVDDKAQGVDDRAQAVDDKAQAGDDNAQGVDDR